MIYYIYYIIYNIRHRALRRGVMIGHQVCSQTSVDPAWDCIALRPPSLGLPGTLCTQYTWYCLFLLKTGH